MGAPPARRRLPGWSRVDRRAVLRSAGPGEDGAADPLTSRSLEGCQLLGIVRRAEVLDVTGSALGGVHDLDRSRSRGRLDRAHLCRRRRLRDRLVRKSIHPNTQTGRSQPCTSRQAEIVARVRLQYWPCAGREMSSRCSTSRGSATGRGWAPRASAGSSGLAITLAIRCSPDMTQMPTMTPDLTPGDAHDVPVGTG